MNKQLIIVDLRIGKSVSIRYPNDYVIRMVK